MAGEFPQLDLRGATSPDVYQPRREADVPDGLGQLGAEADQLGRTLGDMAEKSAQREGQQQAATDVATGQVQFHNDGTVKGDAYDGIARNYLAAQRQGALHEGMAAAFEQNKDNPVELSKAMDGIKAGLGRTGDPTLDSLLDGHFVVSRADYMAQAIAGAHTAMVAQDKANFIQERETAQDQLDRVAAGATADGNGGSRITGAGSIYLQTLAKYGPREAFDIGGVKFPADPTRRAALTPAEISEDAARAVTQARKTWILATAQTLPDAASRKEFAGQVQAKWQAGDPSFAGLDGHDMTELQRQLEATADRARADETAQRTEAERGARDAIDAFTWGGSPDFDKALAQAKASGNEALVAQVQFYRDASPEVKGVLRSVVARQLGLTGAAGGGMVPVDAMGNPVERGVRNNNPGNVKALPAGATWVGQTGVDANGYAIFASPEAGIHAAKSNLRGYGNRGINTVQDIVNTWAPAADNNDPVAYAKTVAAKLHVAPGDKLNMNDPAVIDHLAAAMFNVETPQAQGAWSTPATVQPGTPKYIAWASTQEGFPTDPMKYVRGDANRPAIANVPVLVPEGAFAGGPENQAWAQALAQRRALGQGLSRTYGVPPRMLDNGEADYYKAKLAQDPRAAMALAGSVSRAVGADGAIAFMKELGVTDPTARVDLHIADLAAKGNALIGMKAVQGLQLQGEGKSLDAPSKRNLDAAFAAIRGSVPPTVLTAAYATANAAFLADQLSGAAQPAETYRDWALGQNSFGDGRRYGGPASVNGGQTVLPSWLSADHARDALKAAGDAWFRAGTGPVWSNGQPLTGDQVAGLRLQLQPSGTYRFVNPKTGNPLMRHGGGAFEPDLDVIRPYLGRVLGSAAIRPGR